MLWIGSGTSTLYTLFVFDGTRDFPLVRFDTATGRASAVGSLPVGAVIDFSGTTSSLPDEWALCDGGTYVRSDGLGTISTPDLRDKFVLGASPTIPAGSTGGLAEGAAVLSEFGGDHSHTMSTAGSHNHSTGVAGNHSHGGATGAHSLTAAENGPHSHTEQGIRFFTNNPSLVGSVGNGIGSQSSNTGSSGSGTPHDHSISDDGGHTHSV